MAKDFTQGSVGKKLILFSFPIIAGMLLQTAYNIVDTVFIGMLGAKEIAAVSLTFPVVFIFIAVASGLGTGANALISQAIGKKKNHDANNFAEHALFLGTGMGIAIAVLGILFSPIVFAFMGADAEVLPLTIEYSTPIFVGLIFMFAWFISDSILRAQGNSKIPMRNLAISVVINIVLDPILIFGLGPVPALGLKGAAFATVFSRMLAAVLNFLYIYTPKSTISLSLHEFKPSLGCIKKMLAIGLPASAAQTLTAGGFALLMGIVGSFGSTAIAAFGIGLRVNSVVIMPMVGLSIAVTSFVGQNIGAKQFERAKRVSLLARRMTLGISLALGIVVLVFPEEIMRVFTQDPELVAIGKTYLTISPFAYILFGSYFAFYGAFQGAGKTHLPLITNLVYWTVAVLAATTLSQTIGIEGIWLAFVLASGIEALLINRIFWSNAWLKTSGKKESPAEAKGRH